MGRSRIRSFRWDFVISPPRPAGKGKSGISREKTEFFAQGRKSMLVERESSVFVSWRDRGISPIRRAPWISLNDRRAARLAASSRDEAGRGIWR
jgi:hypothetical protein